MKILISYRAAPRIRKFETGCLVASAFRRLGHDVDEYARVYETWDWLPMNKEGIHPERVFEFEYDFMLNLECNDQENQYHEISDPLLAKKRAVWHYDTSYYVSTALSHIAAYKPDHVFFANADYRKYGVANSSWLPYAADPRFLRGLDHAKMIDVGLVGSDRPARRKLIAALKKQNIDAQLISGVFQEKYIDALASCRIVINENPPEGRGLLNMRFTETMAAGSVLLNNDGDGHVLMDGLSEGIHFLVYRDIDDLVGKCKYLLNDPVERIEMAKRAQDIVEELHMYDHRAQEILDVLF